MVEPEESSPRIIVIGPALRDIADTPGMTATALTRFGAKPDKKIVDRSSGEPEFMEDAFHCNSDGLVVGVDRFWVVRPAC